MEKEEKKISPADTEKDKPTARELESTWATDAQDELEDWIEEQGIQLRY